MKILLTLSITVLFLLNTQNTCADIKTELLVCKSIGLSSHRLECFDNVVKAYDSTASDAIALIEQPQPEKPIEIIQKRAESIKTKPKKENTSNFGMEFADQEETVKSFLVGEFKGWKKGLKLRLKNGQVWKVTSARYGYSKKLDPAVTISRGFFGSFDAKIDGLNARAKVKRIK